MHRIAGLVPVLLLTAGCLGPVKSLYPPAPGETARNVYVVHHGGLHTGIAVEWADIPADLWLAKDDYPQACYLEVGWGDDDGYRKPLTSLIACKALFGSRRTVLQLDGFTNSLAENFNDPTYTVIEIKVSERGLRRLCEHISRTHALDEAGQPIRLGDDWYRAQGTYCLFNTCNTWVASALRTAGCPVTPIYCITRGPLLYQARKIGRAISPQAPP